LFFSFSLSRHFSWLNHFSKQFPQRRRRSCAHSGSLNQTMNFLGNTRFLIDGCEESPEEIGETTTDLDHFRGNDHHYQSRVVLVLLQFLEEDSDFPPSHHQKLQENRSHELFFVSSSARIIIIITITTIPIISVQQRKKNLLNDSLRLKRIGKEI
jgi:hypothetical protein